MDEKILTKRTPPHRNKALEKNGGNEQNENYLLVENRSETILKEVYLPNNCLQGELLPAHILWDNSEQVEISITIPDSIEFKEVYNVSPDSIIELDRNTIKVTKFDINGYLGLLFNTRKIEDKKRLAIITFEISLLRDGVCETSTIEKNVELFRPSIEIIHVPKNVHIKYDSNSDYFSIDEQIKITNSGDGTALLFVELISDEDYSLGPPSRIGDFHQAFQRDAATNLRKLSLEWPNYLPFFELFIDLLQIANARYSLISEKLDVFDEWLEKIWIADRGLLGAVTNEIGAAYLKNVQLITELKSFLEYIDSIGEGRILLMNSIDVIKIKNARGMLHISITCSDLSNNEYPPISLSPISVTCENDGEIPLHLLFDWQMGQNKGKKKGG